MDAVNVEIMVNLTGGHGEFLDNALSGHVREHRERFIVFTEPAWSRAAHPGYRQQQVDLLVAAHTAGARGLKVLKTLGLYLQEGITTGQLIAVDDPRFDPMWDAAGALGMPVAIHTSRQPRAFFLPVDRFNERRMT